MKRKKLKKKPIIITSIILVILFSCGVLTTYLIMKNNIKNNYGDTVIVTKDSNIYDSKKKSIGTIKKGVVINLAKRKNDTEEYYKVQNGDFYVYYKNVEKTKGKEFKNKYLVFNNNIKRNKMEFYTKNKPVLTLNKELSLPIEYMDDKYYYVNYLGTLFGLKRDKEDKLENKENTKEQENSYISVFKYDGVGIDKIKEEIKHLTDNKYESLTLDEYKEYIKGNIRLKGNYVLLMTTNITDEIKGINKESKLNIVLDDNSIKFKDNNEPSNRNNHIKLNLENYKNYKKNLLKLIELQNNKEIAITYKLDLEYIYITFDLNKVKEIKPYKPIENRIFAIDMNPNYIGYSVVDWLDEMNYKIINSGVISIKDLNDYDNSLKDKGLSSESKERKYISNKRNYEICGIAKRLSQLCKHFKCEIFSIEDLNIKASDRCRGTRFNRLCNNQWCRGKFTQVLEKYCKLNSIKLQKVIANYSSFLGNIIYRQENLPDMVLSSIEIGRRGYEFNLQYIKKEKDKKKNIIFPDLTLVKDRINHALEVLKYSESWDNLQKLYYSLKNLKLKYRVSLDENLKFFRLTYRKSFINLYSFI